MTMTNTGMTKSIDALGRIVLPKEIRKSLNLSPGSPLEMLMAENGDLILRKPDREIPPAELLALLRGHAEKMSDPERKEPVLKNIAEMEKLLA